MANLRPFVLLTFVALGACAATGAGGGPVIVTAADQGHTVRIDRGGLLVVKLEAQLGTGFVWHIVRNDAHVLVPLGEPEIERQGEGKPGAVEVQVFRFRGEAAGTSALELAYAQPWQKEAKPAKTFRITVEVH
jgi:predicted secreted protein